MALYSLNGAHPVPLPNLIWLSDGRPRTSQEPFTPEEIADAGYVEAPEQPEYDPATHSLGWDGEGWTLTELPPPPDPEPPAPFLYAIANLAIDGGQVESIAPFARLAGAFYIDVGVYWVFFNEPQPNTDYLPLCYNHNHSVFVSEKYEDFFVINAEADGIPSDPPLITVEIKRVS